MRILIDLIHPANYHYFKHFITEMKIKNHEVIITAREKDVLQQLLLDDGIPFYSSGSSKIGLGGLGKIFYLIYAEFYFLFFFAKKKPDIVLSFGSIPCSHISFIFGIPHISFDDTEHAILNRRFYAPFANIIFTPKCFYLNISKNQFRFNGYMELFYLHKKRFNPNKKIVSELGLTYDQRFVLFRFVSWEAFHDIGQTGLSKCEKIELVKEIEKFATVFISSEGELPIELVKYKINLSPGKIHDVLYLATLYIGEGGTMASEAAILGVPAIYINSLPLMGYLKEEMDSGLLFHLNNYEEIKNKAIQILNDNDSKTKYKTINERFLKDKIEPTSLLIWLVENYPTSKNQLLSNPSLQNDFK